MNTPIGNRIMENIANNKVLKIVLIVVFALLIIANGVQGYFLYKKVKANNDLEAIIKSQSNCEKVQPPAATTPEPTPTTTTPSTRSRGSGSSSSSDDSSDSSGSSGSDSQETVIPPPPPPSD